MNEELGIEISSALPLLRLIHRYPTKTTDLDVWEVSEWHGFARGREGQKIEWITPSKLDRYAFPAANRTVITAVGLPRTVFTVPDLARFPALSLAALDHWLTAGARCFLLYNQYFIKNPDDRVLTQVGHRLNRFNAKLIFDWSLETATTAADFDYGRLLESLRGQIDCDILAGFPCRTPAQLERAEQVGAELLLIGPVRSADFEMENDAIGWSETLRLVAKTMIPAFAFGPLEPQDIARAIVSGCQGLVLPSSDWTTDPTVVMNAVASTISQVEVGDNCF